MNIYKTFSYNIQKKNIFLHYNKKITIIKIFYELCVECKFNLNIL